MIQVNVKIAMRFHSLTGLCLLCMGRKCQQRTESLFFPNSFHTNCSLRCQHIFLYSRLLCALWTHQKKAKMIEINIKCAKWAFRVRERGRESTRERIHYADKTIFSPTKMSFNLASHYNSIWMVFVLFCCCYCSALILLINLACQRWCWIFPNKTVGNKKKPKPFQKLFRNNCCAKNCNLH